MKKIIIILMLCALGTITHAQSIVQSLFSPPASGSHLTDTVTNTGVVVMGSNIVAGAAKNITVTATFTKISGTAAGTATLLGSLNGIDWTSASATSFTVTDVATQTTSWILTSKPFQYYRVSCTGSGTTAYTVKGQVLSVTYKN
jgi:hypothetical protein